MPSYPARTSLDDIELIRGAFHSGDNQSRMSVDSKAGKGGAGGSDCTFKPKIKELPRHYGAPKDRDVPFQTRVMRWQKEKELEARKR